MENRKVLVAGASGYLGRYVVKEFSERGYQVRALVRDPDKLVSEGPNLEPPVREYVTEIFTGDAVNRDSLKDTCKGVDLVFSCMGLTKPQHGVTSEQIDHLGNRALLEDALANGVKKFIYISVFNSQKMMNVDMVKTHEDFVQDLKASGIPYTVIRPAAYFSDMGMFFNMARSGHVFLFGDGSNRFNPIHGADLAKVCVDAVEGSDREIDIGGPEIFTYTETNIMAFEALGKQPSITHVPMWIGDVALFVTGIFNKPMASIMSFAISVSGFDNVAPGTGSRHLKDFYRELASKSAEK
ncbi:MAG: SDR family oxidoreductase [Chlorobiaceae bacterium]|nr:SDR family oxidoreductase [Chlorobiaceae bacterium]